MSHGKASVKKGVKSSSLVCPTCGNRYAFEASKTPPFCSERCQLIDLGRWLNEDISVPYENEPDPQIEDFRE